MSLQFAPLRLLDRPTPTRRVPELVVAHDYFTQRGGGERVAAALIAGLGPDLVVTSVTGDGGPEIVRSSELSLRTSFLQRASAFRRDPRRALPLLPFAWWLMPAVDTGVVLCSSSGWSHLLRTRRTARKVVYCHNPARWLYQPEDYFADQPSWVRLAAGLIRPFLLAADRWAARGVHLYVANSTSVADRIERAYGRRAVVVHPPMMLDEQGRQEPIEGAPERFFLTVGRGRGYKNVATLIEAFRRMPDRQLVAVGQPPAGETLPQNVRFVTDISDAALRWLYANCSALISVSREDFGLTPIEANAFGTPVLVLRAGGFLDSLHDGVSGRFIEDSTPEAVVHAVRAFDPSHWSADAIRRHASRFSLQAFLRRMGELVEAARWGADADASELLNVPLEQAA